MKILLLLNQSYPNGYALPKRFHLYAKGFIYNGHFAKIIIPIPTEKFGDNKNYPLNGIHDNVPFEYSSINNIRSKHFFKRRFDDIYGVINMGFIIFKENPKIIITSNFSILFILYLKILSYIVSFKLIKEKCEIDYLNSDNITKSQKRYIKLINNLYDGFIFITKHIEQYHVHELKSKKPFIIVPILIEDNKLSETILEQSKNILYTGTFLERKDGIITILKAFSIFIKKYPEYKLVMTGNPERSPSYQEINAIIECEKIKSNIEFTGYLTDNDLKKVILNTELHILTKPPNRQNFYNFSTRIGECLTTGRPVIATKVGIIGELLTDNFNIFFTEYSPESISEKIKYLIENKELANNIGNNGKLFALNNFEFRYHTDRMIQFFKYNLLNEY